MKKLIKKVTPDLIINKYHNFKKKISKVIFSGKNVICPICKSKFRIFSPYLDRKNARCLNCGSLERHRLLWNYLNERTDIFSNQGTLKLLHFAPEKLFYNIFSKNKQIEYFPCDLFPERFAYEDNRQPIKADITSIPFEENFFDIVICNHVLEHIIDDRLAMSELFRVMKKGGWGIFQVPIDYNRENTYEDFTITSPEGRKKAFGLREHVRWYGRDYKNRLASVGFKVKEDDYVFQLSSEEIKKYGLDSSEFIYYCTKDSGV